MSPKGAGGSSWARAHNPDQLRALSRVGVHEGLRNFVVIRSRNPPLLPAGLAPPLRAALVMRGEMRAEVLDRRAGVDFAVPIGSDVEVGTDKVGTLDRIGIL